MSRKSFMDNNFLLDTESAQFLYHKYAEALPIIDYHSHLAPKEIWENQPYENITQVWLSADHYKWRAMRSNGIPEEKITGNASDREKFQAWAETIPYCLGNPLYHWTHLELQRYFHIHQTLNVDSAEEIWQKCNEQLANKGFCPRDFITKSKVELIGTTDDPCDNLSYHQNIHNSAEIMCRVLPTFRPDKAVNIEHQSFCGWLKQLAVIVGYKIDSLTKLKEALVSRIVYFAENECCLSDHGMDNIYYEEASDTEVQHILEKRLQNKELSPLEIAQYKTALWCFLGQEYAMRDWVMQLHIGAQRNNNRRMLTLLGPDSGFDSMGDRPIAYPLSRFLDFLEQRESLPKTILYNLNSKDNNVLATMIGNFQGGKQPGKMQFGSAWWFQDQRDGMEAQMRNLANFGLLSRFIGMLTDSRSFLSYPRHEYFRRILCNLIGHWVENGEYPFHSPQEQECLGKIIQDICYHNCKNYLFRNSLL